jgi:hypothetical protein
MSRSIKACRHLVLLSGLVAQPALIAQVPAVTSVSGPSITLSAGQIIRVMGANFAVKPLVTVGGCRRQFSPTMHRLLLSWSNYRSN